MSVEDSHFQLRLFGKVEVPQGFPRNRAARGERCVHAASQGSAIAERLPALAQHTVRSILLRTMTRRFDLSLYLVTDPVMTARRGVVDTVLAAIAGGVTIVQLRDKHGCARALAEAGRALLAPLRAHGIPLLLNDRIDVAHAIGADGVHVGQTDLRPSDARTLLGPQAIIGLSISAAAELGTIEAAVDYVGLGPLFPTGTKTDAAPAMGEGDFAAIRHRIGLPVVAIGGITLSNTARALATGADGIAVVSAICAAADPQAAARELSRAIANARMPPRP